MSKDYGKALRVNLSQKKVTGEKISQEVIGKFIGGKGFAANTLYNELKPGANPLGPDNILVVAVGPITGTNAPGFSKTVFAAKSPLTDIFADSYLGGYLGPEIKSAGYDLIIVEGKAEKPVCLYINDGKASIEDAGDLWGKDVMEAEKALKDRYGKDVQIASIGPAGENLVSYACVCHQMYRQAGRGGMGAVMGSKNLKAIIVNGNGKVKAVDEGKFSKAVKEAHENIRANKVIQEGLSVWGTLNMVMMAQAMGIATVKNYLNGVMEEKVTEQLSGPAVNEKYKPKKLACLRCPIGCEMQVKMKTQKWGEIEAETEFETLMLLGPNIGINDYETIAYLGLLCDKMGLDTIQTGNAIAFAMECYEKGLLTDKDTGGIELTWGSEEAVIKLIDDITCKMDFGGLLAQGVKKLSEKVGNGSEKFAMHVKGLAFPAAWDIRGAHGHGFSFAVSDRGACHTSSDIDFMEFSGLPGISDRFSLEGKSAQVKDTEDLASARETLISCIFNFLPPEIYLKLLNGSLGWNMNMDEFLKVGERTEQLIRAFNIREGKLSRKDDTLPDRVFDDPIPAGPSEGQRINREKFEEALTSYYKLRDWNHDGVPVKKKLEELELVKAAKEIGV